MQYKVLAALALLLLASLSVQAAAPTISSAEYLDLDGDGFLDSVRITFNEPMKDSTVRAGDFRIDGTQATGFSTGTANDAVITLSFRPGLVPDTDALPELSYVPGTATDAQDEALAAVSMTPDDGAAPVLLGASAKEGDDQIVLSFSEDVVTKSGTPAAASDFCFQGPQSILTAIISGRLATLTLDGALASGDIGTVTVAAGTCATTPGATLKDSDDNDVDPTNALAVQTAAISSVQGDVGSSRLIVAFNMPVQAVGGGDLAASAFDLTGLGIDSVDHTEGSQFAVIHLDGPVAASHLGDAGQLALDVVQDAVAAFGNNGIRVQPGASEVTDTRAPRIVSLESVDTDDGVFDAIKLTFDEAIASAGAATRWTVHHGLSSVAVNAIVRGDDGCAEDLDAETHVLYLCIAKDMHAGVLAAVTYAPGTNPVRDESTNDLEAFTHRIAADGIAPRIKTVVAAIGSDKLTVTFNEPVRGTTATLAATHFTYTGSTTIKSVVHAEGSSTVQITLDAALTRAGFTGDTLAAKATVKDLNDLPAGTAAVSFISSDATPPGTIADLNLVEIASDGKSATLNFTAPADDDDSKVAGYEVRHSTSKIDTAAKWTDATVVAAADLDYTVAEPGAEQKIVVSGLSEQTYHFAVRAFDKGNNLGARSDSIPVSTDVTPPGQVASLSTSDATVTSVKLSWTAPADDGTTASSGKVAGYEVRHGTVALAADNVGDAEELEPDFGTLAEPGSTQEVTVTGLLPETEHFFAVRAIDAAGNAGAWAFSQGITTLDDPTPPTGTFTVTSSTHATPSADTDVKLSWSGVSDDESTVTYRYGFTKSATATYPQSTTDTEVDLEATVGTWYFHIRAESAGGEGPNATHMVHVKPERSLAEINKDLQATLQITRNGDDAVLSWGDVSPQPEGVQIWRATSPFTLIGASEGKTFRDAGAPGGAAYIITAFFGSHEELGFFEDSAQLADVPGYLGFDEAQSKAAAVVAPEAPGLPTWAWIVIMVGSFLLMVGIIVAIVLLAKRKKGEPEEAQWEAEPEAWDNEWDVPEQTFHLTCPKCSHDFTAAGVKPLETTCPSCQVRGVLR